MKYKHVLALSPYLKSSTSILGLLAPTGLEYIAASMKELVGKITLMDLKHEGDYQEVDKLSEFIRREIYLLCISIVWSNSFDRVCELICKLPDEAPTIIGGYKATDEV